MTGNRSMPFSVSRYSLRRRWPGSWYGALRRMPSETRCASRWLSTCRGAPVRRCMSSKRRTPLNASRSTRNVHFSPTIPSAAAMLQFAVS